MTCNVCGKVSATEARFCSSCGTALVATATPFYLAAAPPRRLVRPLEGRMIAGVCAGIAQAYDWDLTIVRLVVALAVLLAGLPVLAYLLAWIVMPNASLTLPSQAGAGPGSMAL